MDRSEKDGSRLDVSPPEIIKKKWYHNSELVDLYNQAVTERHLLMQACDKLLEMQFNRARDLRELLLNLQASREFHEEQKTNPTKPVPFGEFIKELEAMI